MPNLGIAAIGACLALALTLGAAGARTVERMAYLLGPLPEDPERAAAILTGRLEQWQAHPEITVTDRGLRVEVDREEYPRLLRRVLTARGYLSFHAVDDEPGTCPSPPRPETECLQGVGEGEPVFVVGPPAMAGTVLDDVDEAADARGMPALMFRFDAAASKAFGQLTTTHLGRKIAVVVDGRVIVAARVMEPILGGSGLLTGDDEDLAVWWAVLSQPPLEAGLEILEETTAEPVERVGRRGR